ncbi:phosphoadenylyl-sulfate reductase [Hyphomicrobium sp.]|uniref:phosphoadenylyl-sulfate reductase n=1 Tax=Hyphomicrobium sp. TaxID=82 RepID=UPI0025C3DA3C|nr:phosphoadenylyl-sulfate reductase [Hyphomicrobium sp.]MCC7250325.1 phosphoadenylyl-sulfate reductase [Hyphomicrobium sp.]
MTKANVRARAGRTAGASETRSAVKVDGAALAQRLDETLPRLDTLEARLVAVSDAIPGRIAFSTSLGLEDQAVLHAIAATGRRFDVFTLDTGRHFPETLETLEASELRYSPLKIRVVFPDAKDVELLVARDGIMGFRQSVEARKACCDVRKVRPLNKALAGAAGWLTGLRREQSAERAHVPFAVWDAEHQLVKLNPIADWSLEQLDAYIADNKVPVNPLHAQGFPSIGCQPCTRAIAPGEDIRAGRWWWENLDGKECGLHNRPKPKEAHA